MIPPDTELQDRVKARVSRRPSGGSWRCRGCGARDKEAILLYCLGWFPEVLPGTVFTTPRCPFCANGGRRAPFLVLLTRV
jgi:hypothetical protein